MTVGVVWRVTTLSVCVVHLSAVRVRGALAWVWYGDSQRRVCWCTWGRWGWKVVIRCCGSPSGVGHCEFC